MPKLKMTGALLAAMLTLPAQAKELKSVGVSLASLGNPFFVAVARGATAEAQKINPNVKVTTLGFDYDLNKQFNQIDNFIAAGVDLIILNPGDPHAVAPAIKRAQAAGIVVVAVDTAADGADITVMTDNVKAGEIACQYIVDKLGGKGDVVIENGPQVSSVVDRVAGCKKAFSAAPGIKVLSADQDAKGSRDGGLAVMQGYLTRYPKLDAVFTINDPQAIGSDLAAKQLGRANIVIASVDGAPDIEKALKSSTLVEASASQDPYSMAKLGVRLGADLLAGKKPGTPITLIAPQLVTRRNVSEYAGWESHR
ncbi:ABC transporter substrate-binding protein [Rhodoblastus sp.]|uniref:ABC transporter substrate-binding protein n=1 Tax=Rhodoblastus sp. TaxID=1962975 RepID=UPI0026207519|nr:ABC transporter substrate-binding protein [Rhodoblastus sp.]